MSGSQAEDDSLSESDAEPSPRRGRFPNLGPLPNLPLPIPPQVVQPQVAQQPVPNNPAPQNAQQNAPQNAPQNAQANAGPQPNARPANDSNEQRLNRRWSVWAKGVFHLPDAKGQNQILASAVATFARIDESTLQPGKAATLANTPATQNDPLFATFVTELGRYEALPLPREEPQSKALRAAALAARPGAANDPVRLGPIDEVLAALKAFELRNKITGAGRPPWEGQVASDATAAKIELDMMSLGPNRTLTVQGGGVNPSYWVERKANDGAPAKKSYLCKPPGALVGGIPAGGEIPREALTGRAASALKEVMPFDLDMPETHVVSMPANAFPQAPHGAVNGQVSCSVQEAKDVRGDFEGMTVAERANIPAPQCAAAIMLDLVTLNTDRHINNLLVGTDGRLVPIDHGCAFPEADAPGKSRMRNLMSGPHNATLQLAGSHAPMTGEMAAGLRGLDPKGMRDKLAQSAGDVGQQHGTAAGLISPGSLDASMASTRMLKLSADIWSGKKANPIRLSPASVMAAFGSNAVELLAFPPPVDDKVAKPFDKRAKEILKQALADQPLLEKVCLMENSSFAKLEVKLRALGWSSARRADQPTETISSDPALCAKLLAGNFRNPLPDNDKYDLNKQFAAARRLVAKVKPQAALQALAECELEGLLQIAPALPQQRAAALTQNLTTHRQALLADDGARKALIQEVETELRQGLSARWATFSAQYDLAPNSFGFQKAALIEGPRRGAFVEWKGALDQFDQAVAQGRPTVIPKNQPAPNNPAQNNPAQNNPAQNNPAPNNAPQNNAPQNNAPQNNPPPNPAPQNPQPNNAPQGPNG